MTYQPGIPTGTVNLDVDYLNIQNNFQQLDTQFAIDHIPFSDTSGIPPGGVNGYHTSVHFNPESTTATNPPNNYPPSTPAATPGFGQLFSCQVNDGINVDQALYFLTGGNRLSALTRNFQPVAATNGYTFLPGGLILQWGKNTTSSSSGTVTFSSSNIAFPSACFSVWTQPFYNSASPPTSTNPITYGIAQNLLSRTSFAWRRFTDSGSYTGFYWIALGN